MNTVRHFFVFALLLLTAACKGGPEILSVPYCETGSGWFGSYPERPLVGGLRDYWAGRTDSTAFYACHDSDSLYLAAYCSDQDIHITEGESERSVDTSDRIELFLAQDEGMSSYYCLEIDPNGKIMDYKASFYRQFDFNWDCPGIRVRGISGNGSYSLRISLSLDRLRELGVLQEDGTIIAGLYRGDYHPSDGSISWYSWLDPHTPEPDFHVPASLGRLELAR